MFVDQGQYLWKILVKHWQRCHHDTGINIPTITVVHDYKTNDEGTIFIMRSILCWEENIT